MSTQVKPNYIFVDNTLTGVDQEVLCKSLGRPRRDSSLIIRTNFWKRSPKAVVHNQELRLI